MSIGSWFCLWPGDGVVPLLALLLVLPLAVIALIATKPFLSYTRSQISGMRCLLLFSLVEAQR